MSLLCFGACNNKNQQLRESKVLSDSSNQAKPSLPTNAVSTYNNGKKFVKSGEIKCEVKNVESSTYNIENICKAQGGFINYSNLESKISSSSKIAISQDSTLITNNYAVTNQIILTVPNAALDTTLKAISENFEFLDYRVFKADEVSIQMYANTLTEKRAVKKASLLKNTAVLNNTVVDKFETETEIDHNKIIADNAVINNLQLSDKVAYSTVNISLYQQPTIKKEMIVNQKVIPQYEPSLGFKMMESIKTGWSIFEIILVNVTKLWGFILLFFIILALVKRYSVSTKASKIV